MSFNLFSLSVSDESVYKVDNTLPMMSPLRRKRRHRNPENAPNEGKIDIKGPVGSLEEHISVLSNCDPKIVDLL